MKPVVIAICAALALAACMQQDQPRPAPVVIAPTLEPYVPGESAIYCYRTLADVVCSSEPQPGPPNRLVGAYRDRPVQPATD